MSVKPANYSAFVRFSIAVYDALETRGWERLSKVGVALGPARRVLIESFPLSAWRSLGIAPLPAKRKARSADLGDRLAKLEKLFPLRLFGPTNARSAAGTGFRSRRSGGWP